MRLTKLAADKKDSPRFIGIILASSLCCYQAESRPTHLRLTQADDRLHADERQKPHIRHLKGRLNHER